MAGPQLAKSMFTRTPSEETAVADVYKENGDSTVNSFQDITGTSTELVDSISFLSKSNSSKLLIGPTLEKAASLQETVESTLGNATSKVKSEVSSMLGSAKGGLAIVADATKTIGGVIKQGLDAYSQVNGVVTALKSGNLKDIRNITNTLNTVVGKTSVLLSPNGATGKLYGILVDQASAAGISDSFKLVADSVKASTEMVNKGTVLYGMAKTSLPGALSRGDYKNVASMVESLGSGAINMLNPNAVSQLSKNNTTKVKPSDIGGSDGQFVKYQDAYQKIDPGWNISKWKTAVSGPIKDLSKLADAAKETKEVFSTGAKLANDVSTRWYSALDAIKVKPTVDSVIKKQYPLSAISNSKTMVAGDSDPRIQSAWFNKATIT